MRYTEAQAKKPTDFKPRRRLPTALQFFGITALTYLLLAAFFAVSSNLLLFGVWSFAVLAILAGYITYVVNYNRDLLLATEFQNAMFAGAIGTDQLFSIITREDGSIVFADQGIKQYLPSYSRIMHTNIDDIFKLGGMVDEHQRTAFDAIALQQKESLLVGMYLEGASERTDLVLSIEPIVTQGRFNLVRVRKYLDKRTDSARGVPAPAVTETTQASSPSVDLFEEAPIAIVRCNNEGAIIHVNKAFDQLIGLNGTPRPQGLLDLVAKDKQEEISALVTQLLNPASDVVHVDVEFLLPNDEKVDVSIFANRPDQDDIVTFYLIDVSEQKSLEHRFAHSQKMQAVGQLAGGVAHDFNNLLTAMIGFCDLLLMRHPAGDQSFADIMQIKQNANRAAGLVRQLLAFSRKQTLQAKNLDITEVLAELSNLVRRLIGENIELKMIHGRDLSMVKADQGQLEQVVINLAVNARDAMTDGGVLTIRSNNVRIDSAHPLPSQMLAPVGEDGTIPFGDYVLIEVSDTGTGIPKDVMPKIFEPFFSTKEIGSGTGLGLATVYGIIKQTGGYVFVNSVENKGTQFHIYFPALSAAEEKIAEAEVQEQNAQDLTGRETILLVEDETPVRTFASRALKNKGYTVIEADCGETGLEQAREHGSRLDLIVTDVIMPGMNGPTMVEQISDDLPDIRVIFMSGYAEDIFVSNYGSERSFNFLAKPFTLKQLAAKVKEVLSS